MSRRNKGEGAKKKRRKQPGSKGRSAPQRRELQLKELEAIVERAKTAPLSAEDHETLQAAVDTLAWLTSELEAKGASIRRLRKLLFGASTEKTSQVVGAACDADTDENAASAGDGATSGTKDNGAADESKPKPKGHGRNSAADYEGAERKEVPQGTLSKGDRCPECQRGKVYPLAQPAVLVRVSGMAPLVATVYALERLRCNLCGVVFTAEAPSGVGNDKYDETAAAMIGLLKYGCGLPFNRLERLEGNLGIPLPASTQWEVAARAAGLIRPAHEELIHQAAQGEVIHNDDTTMKILELDKQSRSEALSEKGTKERTGTFTSGIVATGEGHRIALFFTGRNHAGENLAEVLGHRSSERPPPIQMCDALSRNTAGDFKSIVANCIAHARRQFVDVVDNFPDECRHVLEQLREVYQNDATARAREMTPEERLRFHQSHSGPVMEALEAWLNEQLDERKVEPNSGLGDAIEYMLKHWKKLTLFLHEAGAPLDNNICYAARGITDTMPHPGLCRVGAGERSGHRGIPNSGWLRSRHSPYRFLRNASRLSDGRKRCGITLEASA